MPGSSMRGLMGYQCLVRSVEMWSNTAEQSGGLIWAKRSRVELERRLLKEEDSRKTYRRSDFCENSPNSSKSSLAGALKI